MDSRGHQRPLTLKYTICKPSFNYVSTAKCEQRIRWLQNSVQSTICLNVTQYTAHLQLEFFFDGWCQKKYPCSRKRVIFKLKSSQKCYIFGDFLNCTMFNSSMWGSLTSLKVRQCRNVFFQVDDSSKKRTKEFLFLPNSTMIAHCFIHFLEEFEGTKKSFWN